jgi:negative regulator of flagellin synthesis FlgM
MKIESTGKSAALTSTAETRPRAPTSTSTQQAGSADKVQLSTLSASLQKAESAMSRSPVVDTQRVEEIKQAISSGQFKINAERIADGLIDSVRDMLANQR